MKKVLIVLMALVATGCSSGPQTFSGPNGEVMVGATCGGIENWAHCGMKIAQACSAHGLGYKLVMKDQIGAGDWPHWRTAIGECSPKGSN